MRNVKQFFGAMALAGLFSGVALAAPQDVPRDAAPSTAAANEATGHALPFADRQDYEEAQKGFIAPVTGGVVKNAKGDVIWDVATYRFLEGAAPATANPSLWRQAQLNRFNGLFKVADRVYQARGFDLANMDIIEGDSGLILVDPLTTAETARAALELYYQHRPRKPVVAVIYTHSHVDHFGGVGGVVTDADVRAGKVKLIAPAGFMEHAVSENVFAGNAMSRRASYIYGSLLRKGERGQIDAGLGKTTSAGTVTLIAPNDSILKSGETRRIDGVDIEFFMAPDSEAPAEMLMYFPQFRALCAAEDATHTQHQIYTLRGAQVRDSLKWSDYLGEIIDRYGDRTDVIFAQHHWPMWGQARIGEFLRSQRDMYRYLHDQTLRLINLGYTAPEIAAMLELPSTLGQHWYNRGYYGTLSHNVKGIYQRYLGWYDGNPATLDALPPVETARRTVEYMGGADAVIAKARTSYAQGDFRWVAQVMSQVVYANPDNKAARDLEADALEQLGYRAESALWRNSYLEGAVELRNGLPQGVHGSSASPDTLRAMTLDQIFNYLALRLNGPKADGVTIRTNWIFPDAGEKYALTLENCALLHNPRKLDAHPDVTVTLDRATLDALMLKQVTLPQAVASGRIKLEGDASRLTALFGLLDQFEFMFPIVTPRPTGR